MRLSAFHPVTALVYFVAVLVITMFCFSPAVAVCSAVGAFLFCAVTQSRRQFLSDLLFYAFITAVLTICTGRFQSDHAIYAFCSVGRLLSRCDAGE